MFGMLMSLYVGARSLFGSMHEGFYNADRIGEAKKQNDPYATYVDYNGGTRLVTNNDKIMYQQIMAEDGWKDTWLYDVTRQCRLHITVENPNRQRNIDIHKQYAKYNRVAKEKAIENGDITYVYWNKKIDKAAKPYESPELFHYVKVRKSIDDKYIYWYSDDTNSLLEDKTSLFCGYKEKFNIEKLDNKSILDLYFNYLENVKGNYFEIKRLPTGIDINWIYNPDDFETYIDKYCIGKYDFNNERKKDKKYRKELEEIRNKIINM